MRSSRARNSNITQLLPRKFLKTKKDIEKNIKFTARGAMVNSHAKHDADLRKMGELLCDDKGIVLTSNDSKGEEILNGLRVLPHIRA